MKLAFKVVTSCVALLICTSFFIATAYSSVPDNHSETTSPQALSLTVDNGTAEYAAEPQYEYEEIYIPLNTDVVHAEINGTVLRVEVDRTWFDAQTVYVNDRRFHHSAGNQFSIDISRYIAEGETIAVFAANAEGYISNIVLLTPPPPPPPNITPDGQGEVIDHVTDEDGVEFFTISTQAGNIFHLIIDHSRDNNNVYFLNAVTEWDLIMMAYVAELPEPAVMPPRTQAQPPTTQVVEEESPEEPLPPPTEPEPELEPEPEPEPSGGLDMRFVMLGIMAVGGLGAVAYVKFFKGKQYHEDDDDDQEPPTSNENSELEDIDDFDDGFDTIDEVEENQKPREDDGEGRE